MVDPAPVFGGTPWPAGRLRLEVRQLTDDLRAWGPYRPDDVGESFRRRANRVLLHLRSRPDGQHRRLPPEFAFDVDELAHDDGTVTEAGADRLRAFVAELAALLPGGGVQPRTALPLTPLHPHIAAACGAAWRAGALTDAVEAARAAVLRRLAGLGGRAVGTDAAELVRLLATGEVAVGPPGASEQSGLHALAVGLLAVADGVRDLPAARFDADRAFEVLALASLVLHRLEFAERRPARIELPDPLTDPLTGTLRGPLPDPLTGPLPVGLPVPRTTR